MILILITGYLLIKFNRLLQAIILLMLKYGGMLVLQQPTKATSSLGKMELRK